MRLIDADALKELIDVKGANIGITNANRCNFKDMLKMVHTVDAEPVRHGHWEIEIIPPTGADTIKAIGRCSYCGCDDSVHHKSAMGYYKGIPVVWSGFITNYFGHETEAAKFASVNAGEMPKRRYCPDCGAKMDEVSE